MLEQLETKASKWLGHDQFSATAADTWHGLRLFPENVEIELGSSPILANDFPTWDFKGPLIEPYYEPQANKMDNMEDSMSGGKGKRVSVRVEPGGRRTNKK